MKKQLLAVLASLFMSMLSQAQNTFPANGSVGIGTTSPHSSSLLEVKSTTKGVLFPRMTLTQRNAIPVATSTTGLLIYQTDNTPGFYYHNGTSWKAVTPFSAANTALSNLSTTTAISQSLLPGTTAAKDLGSSAKQWRNLYLSNQLTISNAAAATKLDVMGGNWDVTNTEGDVRIGNSTYRLKIGVATAGGGAGDVRIRPAGGSSRLMLGAKDAVIIDSAGLVGIGSLPDQDELLSVIVPAATFRGEAIFARNDLEEGIRAWGGILGIVGESDKGIGIEGISNNNYGVYGRSSTNYAGYFDGNVYTTGSYLPSARQLKQNIHDMSSGMELINKLQPKEYEYKQEGNYKLMHLPQGKRYGLIAEDLGQVLPNLVRDTKFDTRLAQAPDSAGRQTSNQPSEVINFKAVNYVELIPIMVKGMQEQQQQIQELKATNEQLIERLNKLEALLTGSKSNSISEKRSAAYMEQSTPNPSRGSALIRYHIPSTINSATMVLTDMKGSVLKSTTLSSKGSGQISVNTAALSPGTYTYNLYVDGRKADSKQMIVSQ